MTTTPTPLDPLAPSPVVLTGPADALALEAHALAVKDVMDDRIAVARDLIDRTAAGEPGWKLEDDRYGSALVTTPSLRAKIVDAGAWEAWAADAHPSRVRTVERVAPTVLEDALARDDTAGRMLREVLEAIPGALVTDRILDGDLLDEITDPTAEGPLHDVTSGEEIPGVEAAYASSPSLRVTVDKRTRRELADELGARLGAVQLPEETPDA